MKNINILIGFLLVMVLYACYDDQGNYNYDYMDDIQVTNFTDVDFSYKHGSEIYIEPNVVTNIPEDELSYMWLLNVNGLTYDTLSYDKNLDVLAHFSSGDVQFRVIHEPSGVHRTFSTQILILQAYSSGWGFISNLASKSEFSFLSNIERTAQGEIAWEYYPHLYSSVNNEYLPPNAKKLIYNFGFEQWAISYDNDGHIFSSETMEKEQSISEYFATMDYVKPPFSPDAIGFTNKEVSKSLRFVCTGGDMFAATQINEGDPFSFYAPIAGQHYIKDKLTRVGNDQMYLVFDEDAQRYRYINLRNASSRSEEVQKVDPLPDSDGIIVGEGIDVNNLGMECVFLNYAGISWDKPVIYSILKNSAGEFFIHTMDTNTDKPWDPNPYDVRFVNIRPIDPSIMDENTIIFNPEGSKTIFFIKGNAIHAYVGSNDAFKTNWFEASKEIKAVYITDTEIGLALPNGGNTTIEIRSRIDKKVITSLEIEGDVVDLKKI